VRHLLDEQAPGPAGPGPVRHPEPAAPAGRRNPVAQRSVRASFDPVAIKAQKSLWSLQGQGGVWFCGAHFGAGFHEDGLQSGLAVAEQLGGVRRPWTVENESGRIHLSSPSVQMEPAA
jgi:predicted NAD/FAD-binding protein